MTYQQRQTSRKCCVEKSIQLLHTAKWASRLEEIAAPFAFSLELMTAGKYPTTLMDAIFSLPAIFHAPSLPSALYIKLCTPGDVFCDILVKINSTPNKEATPVPS